MTLRSDLIPHKEFHKGLWLLNQKSPWFFFLETPRKYTIPQNKDFYKTVDDDLLKIVKLFHSKDIPTTPSCSGHIKDLRTYVDVFDSLLNIQKDIKKDGIYLKNPETNRKFYYKNPKYKISTSRDQFLHEIEDYQKKGVLGFQDDGQIFQKIADKVKSNHENGITMVFTKGNTSDQIKNNWKKIYKLINQFL